MAKLNGGKPRSKIAAVIARNGSRRLDPSNWVITDTISGCKIEGHQIWQARSGSKLVIKMPMHPEQLLNRRRNRQRWGTRIGVTFNPISGLAVSHSSNK